MNPEIESWPGFYSHYPDLGVTIDNFRLRPLRWNDRIEIRRWRNSQISILRQRVELSASQQDDYFKSVVAREMRIQNPPQILLGLDLSGEFVAYGGLVHISWLDQHAEMSFLTDPAYSANDDHRRLLDIFVRLLSDLSLNKLGLHRLFTETYSSRTEHIEMLEKLGFCREGVLREHVMINGEYVDSVLHGLILE